MCGSCCIKICTSTVRQHLGSAGVGHGALALGILLGWSSLAIPELLKKSDTLGKISPIEASWISNISLLGALCAVLPIGLMVDRFGRRITILISSFPILIGWILMSIGNSVGILCFGRFLAGISGGAFSVIIPLYVTEIAETRLRGAMGYSFTQQLCAGAMIVFIMGKFASWKILGFKAIPISIILFIAAYFLPESPHYLFIIGDKGKGTDSLKWFRTTTEKEIIEAEVKEIESRVDRMTMSRHNGQSLSKGVGIPAVLMLLQQLSCAGHLIFGIVSISDVIGGKTMNPSSVVLIIIITPVVTMGLAALIVDRVGRRPLLILSTLVMSLSFFLLGCCIYVQTDENDSVLNKFRWIRLISFVSYIFAYSFGLGPISWLLMAELVPDRRKGFYASIVTIFNWLPAFILGKYFLLFVYFLTLPGFIWFCAIICIFAAFFSYLFVPETSKMSLPEIQDFLEDNLKMNHPV